MEQPKSFLFDISCFEHPDGENQEQRNKYRRHNHSVEHADVFYSVDTLQQRVRHVHSKVKGVRMERLTDSKIQSTVNQSQCVCAKDDGNNRSERLVSDGRREEQQYRTNRHTEKPFECQRQNTAKDLCVTLDGIGSERGADKLSPIATNLENMVSLLCGSCPARFLI